MTMSQRLYKYIADPNALLFILRGTVKFTPTRELNDPSELTPCLNLEAVQESLERLRRDGYSTHDMVHLRRQEWVLRHLAPRFLAAEVPSSPDAATAIIRSTFYDAMPRLERLLTDAAREISSKVGMLCLSRRYDSLPMWAHYARNASGLVVEFKDLSNVFKGDETGVLRCPLPIRYERERAGMTFEPQSHESLFLEKFEDWNYEREVRVILPLSDCRQETIDGKAVYVYDIPSAAVARLILGWNMPNSDAARVHTYVSSTNSGVEVVRARFTRGHVDLHVAPTIQN